jgi:hypothetical protein
MLDEPEALVSFHRFDDGVVPVPSARGYERLRALRREHQLGPPFSAALRSHSMRRTLDLLDALSLAQA